MTVGDRRPGFEDEPGGGSRLSLEVSDALQRALAALRRDADAQCVLLSDADGSVVAQVGGASGLPVDAVLPALASGIPTSASLADAWDEDVVLSLHHFEVGEHGIYTATSSDLPYLLVSLGWARAPAYSGVLWLFVRRTMQELRGILGAGGLVVSEATTNADDDQPVSLGDLTADQARAMGLVADEVGGGG